MNYRIAFLLGAILAVNAATAQDSLYHFELEHTTAEALIPVLSQILDDDEAVTGQGMLLIVRADAAKAAQLETLIHKLDKPLAPLLISVRRGIDVVSRNQEIDSDIRYDNRDSAQTAIQIRGGLRHSTNDENAEQSVRSYDGGVVAISTGELVALPTVTLWRPGLMYQELSRGFVVRARLAGQQVLLDVDVRNDHLDSGQINTGNLSTTVTAELGHWTYLSGTESVDRVTGHANAAVYRTRSGTGEAVYIRVDRLD